MNDSTEVNSKENVEFLYYEQKYHKITSDTIRYFLNLLLHTLYYQ